MKVDKKVSPGEFFQTLSFAFSQRKLKHFAMQIYDRFSPLRGPGLVFTIMRKGKLRVAQVSNNGFGEEREFILSRVKISRPYFQEVERNMKIACGNFERGKMYLEYNLKIKATLDR